MKIEQDMTTFRLMLVQNYMRILNEISVSLVIIKILVLVSRSILSPKTRSLTLMILQIKPKIVNVL